MKWSNKEGVRMVKRKFALFPMECPWTKEVHWFETVYVAQEWTSRYVGFLHWHTYAVCSTKEKAESMLPPWAQPRPRPSVAPPKPCPQGRW